MERKRYSIRLTGERNKYVEGRILGIVVGVTRNADKRSGYPILKSDVGTMLSFDATEHEYEIIKDLVISLYGELKEPIVEFVKF